MHYDSEPTWVIQQDLISKPRCLAASFTGRLNPQLSHDKDNEALHSLTLVFLPSFPHLISVGHIAPSTCQHQSLSVLALLARMLNLHLLQILVQASLCPIILHSLPAVYVCTSQRRLAAETALCSLSGSV